MFVCSADVQPTADRLTIKTPKPASTFLKNRVSVFAIIEITIERIAFQFIDRLNSRNLPGELQLLADFAPAGLDLKE